MGKWRGNKDWKKTWKPQVKFADPPWDIEEKHDRMIEVLLTGRFPLLELQEFIGVVPTKEEKQASGKYGHVMGITYLIQLARRNGWPVRVQHIDGLSWAYLPQSVMDEEG